MSGKKFESIQLNNWKNVHFIKGKLATKEDIDFGRAIFQINGKDQKHTPLNIEIPNLAFHIDQEKTQKPKSLLYKLNKLELKKL